MKIIKNNHNHNTMELTCPYCNSVLEINDEDVNSEGFVICPCCKYPIEVKTERFPTIDDIRYPEDFYSFENGVDIPPETIEEWIRDGFEKIKYKDNDLYYITSGNTFVLLHKMGEEVYIMVTKNYKDTTICKE